MAQQTLTGNAQSLGAVAAGGTITVTPSDYPQVIGGVVLSSAAVTGTISASTGDFSVSVTKGAYVKVRGVDGAGKTFLLVEIQISSADSANISAYLDTAIVPAPPTGTYVETFNTRNGDVSFLVNDFNAAQTALQISGANTTVAGNMIFTAPVTPSTTLGATYWDDTHKTLSVQTSGNTTLQIGQENITRVLNNTASTITNGSVVRVTGAGTGDLKDRPTVSLAQANTHQGSLFLGVATHDILAGQEGFITTHGTVNDVSCTGLTAGDTLYLSATTPGAYTKVKPVAPNHPSIIGFALNDKNENAGGAIFVQIEYGFELSDAHDVSVTTPANGDILVYESSTGLWKNGKKIGDGTNYTMFEADGTMVMVGTATTHDDLLGAVTALQQTGPGITFNTTECTVDITNVANASDFLWQGYQLSHAWKEGSILQPHIHWEQTTSVVPNFLIGYRYQINGGTKVTPWSYKICNVPAFTYVSGTLNQICKVATGITPVAWNISDILQVKVWRDNANNINGGMFTGVDTAPALVSVTSVDVHIEKDTIGSRSEFTK